MSVINLWLFNLSGIIIHGNSLSNEFYTGWEIQKGGYIFEIDRSLLEEVTPEVKKEIFKKPQQLVFL